MNNCTLDTHKVHTLHTNSYNCSANRIVRPSAEIQFRSTGKLVVSKNPPNTKKIIKHRKIDKVPSKSQNSTRIHRPTNPAQKSTQHQENHQTPKNRQSPKIPPNTIIHPTPKNHQTTTAAVQVHVHVHHDDDDDTESPPNTVHRRRRTRDMGHGAKCTDTLINYPTRARTETVRTVPYKNAVLGNLRSRHVTFAPPLHFQGRGGASVGTISGGAGPVLTRQSTFWTTPARSGQPPGRNIIFYIVTYHATSIRRNVHSHLQGSRVGEKNGCP